MHTLTPAHRTDDGMMACRAARQLRGNITFMHATASHVYLAGSGFAEALQRPGP